MSSPISVVHYRIYLWMKLGHPRTTTTRVVASPARSIVSLPPVLARNVGVRAEEEENKGIVIREKQGEAREYRETVVTA